MALITDPADLIKMYLTNSGTSASKLPVPPGMGDLRERMLQAAYSPDYVTKSRADLVGKGEMMKPVEPGKLLPTPDPIKPLAAPPEETTPSFELPKDDAQAKAREALKTAAGAGTGVGAATTPGGGATAGVTTTPEPHQFEGQYTQNPNRPKDQAEFYAMIRPHADKIAAETGLDVNLVMAKIALETGYGAHAPGFNYFGIKETDPKKGQVLATKESVDGKMVDRQERFRTYGNIGESVSDYITFLKSNGRYADLLKAKGLEEQLAALQKSGYATDPNYATKLRAIIAKIPQTKLPAAAPTVANTPEPPSEPGKSVGEHKAGWFWNGTSWDKAYARGGHIKDLLALSRSYR